MFEFLSMMGNYESRKVDRYNGPDGFYISTAAVNDSDHHYETAVAHPQFNDGKLIIVEMYDTKAEAQAGHTKWVQTMTAKTLPKSLADVFTSEGGLY